MYRKATNTNVILNYVAVCPMKWKLGLMNGSINRAYVICNSWSLLHAELERLKNMFTLNGYPKHIFEQAVSRFLDKKCNPPCDDKNSSDDKDKNSYVITIPYIGNGSIRFKKQLVSIYKKFNIDIKVVFSSFKVGKYFSLKSKTPLDLKARVIYQYNCTCDRTMSYIGKTKRHLAIRVKEHFTRPSAIRSHLIDSVHECKESFDINNFRILNTGKDDFELYIKEALYIKYRKPYLNKQLNHNGACFALNIF